MGSANERRRCYAMSSLIGWAHTQNDPGDTVKLGESKNLAYVARINTTAEVANGSTSPLYEAGEGHRWALLLRELTHCFLKDVEVILQVYVFKRIFELISWIFPVKLVLGECHRNDKSTQPWCRLATSQFLNQCWPRSPIPHGVIRSQRIN